MKFLGSTRKTAPVVIAGAVGILAPMTAGAQTVDSAPQTTAQLSPSAIEDIIVTARKREEPLQKVPISISAYSGGDLDKMGIRNLQSLYEQTPSLKVSVDSANPNYFNVTLRGQRPAGDVVTVANDSPTSVYVDNTLYARNNGLNGTLFDIESLQIYRGPQGTLFGRNTTGGAIVYAHVQPQPDFGGYARLDLGNYNRRNVEGAINVPLTDDLAMRVSGSLARRDGWEKNYFPGGISFGNEHQDALLASIKWQPDATTSILLRGSYSYENSDAVQPHVYKYNGLVSTAQVFTQTPLPQGVSPVACATACAYTDPFKGNVVWPVGTWANLTNAQIPDWWSTASEGTANGQVKTYVASVDIQKKLGKFDVNLFYAFKRTTSSSTSNGAGGGLIFLANPNQNIGPVNNDAHQAELTLNSKWFDDRLLLTTGAFFFHEADGGLGNGGITTRYTAAGVPINVILADLTGTTGKNLSYAAYGQATYSIFDRLRFTAGVRYSVDVRDGHQQAFTTTRAFSPNFTDGAVISRVCNLQGIIPSTGLFGRLPNDACARELHQKFEKPTYTFSLDFDLTPQTMLYLTTRSGYRSGVINLRALIPQLLQTLPETVTDYEAGVKSTFKIAGAPGRLNLSAYYTDLRNKQVSQAYTFYGAPGLCQPPFPNVTPSNPNGDITQCPAGTTIGNAGILVNAKKAKIMGVEFEGTLNPFPSLLLSASGSYTYSDLTDFKFDIPAGYAQVINGVTVIGPAAGIDLSGTSTGGISPWQVSANATYKLPIRAIGNLKLGSVSYNIGWSWRSDQNVNSTFYNHDLIYRGYSLFNMRLDIRDVGNTGIDVGLYASNVFDKKYCSPTDLGAQFQNAGLRTLTFGNTYDGNPADQVGVYSCRPGPPRMFGMQLSRKF